MKKIKKIFNELFEFDIEDLPSNMVHLIFLLFGFAIITAILITGLGNISAETFRIIVLAFIIAGWFYFSLRVLANQLQGIFQITAGIAIIGFGLSYFGVSFPLVEIAGYIGGVGIVICTCYSLYNYKKPKVKNRSSK